MWMCISGCFWSLLDILLLHCLYLERFSGTLGSAEYELIMLCMTLEGPKQKHSDVSEVTR